MRRLVLRWPLVLGDAQAAPPTMQAIVQGQDALALQTVPTPVPAAGQVLVRVYAAGVNPVDWKRKPPIPGFDAAGVVESVGSGVTNWKPGDAVVARVSSGYAQYAIAPATDMVAKPRSLTFTQAGGIPVASVAAYRAVMEARVHAGQRVAIIGAAGGAGAAAVQITKALDARVIASAHSSQQAYLQALGVDEFVAYDRQDVAALIRNVDAVLNMVDGQARASLGYVKPGGHFASIAGNPGEDQCKAARATCVVIAPGYQGISDGEALRALAALADKGQYTVTVAKTFPLAEAAAAQQLNRTSDTTGKIILVVDPAASGR
jgi:NADPH:quinone reductase-like Zn-dependent oxidoreductase